MPAVAPYVPVKDSNFNAWAVNLSTLASANPGWYGLTAGDAATIAGEVATWTAAYAPMLSPTTKTPAAVAAKNTARVTLTAQLRPYCQLIARNPGVSSANKVALGLNPLTSTPTPISAPASSPVLTVQSLGNLSAILRYRDNSSSVTSKAKPYGVKACQVFGMTSTTPVASPVDLSPLLAQGVKSPLQLAFPADWAGKTVYCWAYWVTQRGLKSPPSGVISFTVPTHS